MLEEDKHFVEVLGEWSDAAEARDGTSEARSDRPAG